MIITGSHRTYSNSRAIAEEFEKGAKAAGHEVYRFDSAHKKIHPCIGCDECNMNGPCIYKDDMDELRDHLVAADAVVLASPMYYFGFSAQLAAVIDRFYAFNPQITGKKKCFLIISLCGDDLGTAAGIEKQYEIIAKFLKWNDCGRIIAPKLCPENAVANTVWLAKAYDMGKNLK